MLIAGWNAQTVGVLKKQCQPSTGIGTSLSEAASQEYDVVDILAGKAVTAKQARLKKEEAEKCTEENAAACYDHTGNIGIGPVKVGSSTACIFCIPLYKECRAAQNTSSLVPIVLAARGSRLTRVLSAEHA